MDLAGFTIQEEISKKINQCMAWQLALCSSVPIFFQPFSHPRKKDMISSRCSTQKRNVPKYLSILLRFSSVRSYMTFI